ncbi:cyclic nucleotide-binding domain-containing protein [Agrobacterium vitis]|nr:cyclic nucleotide-binding domain-containing protein [Agrobacterium vitis]MVA89278.1 cyclic nucleotide-binding domain-containing protein [Agrobacterium vitis]
MFLTLQLNPNFLQSLLALCGIPLNGHFQTMPFQPYIPIVSNLRSHEPFALLDPKVLAEHERAFRIRKYLNGQTIFQAGDACHAVGIILSGGVHLSFQSISGHEVIFRELRAGEMIGDSELALGSTYGTSATATEETRLAEIDGATFTKLAQLPPVAHFWLHSNARKLHAALQFAEGLALQSLEARLARVLLELADRHGRTTPAGTLIDRVIPQHLLGQLINASRPKVNIQLQIWKSREVIQMQQHRILIVKPELLRSKAGWSIVAPQRR